jgi:hypothetical protein
MPDVDYNTENLIHSFFLIVTKETPIKRMPQYPLLVIFSNF